jgi:hypothetical protein
MDSTECLDVVGTAEVVSDIAFECSQGSHAHTVQISTATIHVSNDSLMSRVARAISKG